MVDAVIKKLPNWIKYDRQNGVFRALLEPLQCERCAIMWYPRIKRDGTIEIPTVCPGCHSAVWWKKRAKTNHGELDG